MTNDELITMLLDNTCPRDMVGEVRHFKWDLCCINLEVQAEKVGDAWIIYEAKLTDLA